MNLRVERSVCICGAGAAGLSAIKNISSTPGFSGTVYELTEHIGGIWFYTDKFGADTLHPSVYKDMRESSKERKLSAVKKMMQAEGGICMHNGSHAWHLYRTNLPKEIMGFSLDFPFHKGKSSYVSHEEVNQYLHEYASHFQLWKHIKFNTRVVSVKRMPFNNNNNKQQVEDKEAEDTNSTLEDSETKWLVTVQNIKTMTVDTQEFDSVIVCTGHYWKPLVPDIVNLEHFRGTVLHSKDYRRREIFTNKRVCVVGGGPSGVELAWDAAQVAKEVIISLRNPPLPSKFPANVRQTFSIKSATRTTFLFEDNQEFECDILLLCSGYQYDFPFLDEETCGIRVEQWGKEVHPLYRHMIHTKYPSLCFIGLPFRCLPFYLCDIQMRYFVKYLEGLIKLPTEGEMNEERHKDKRLRTRMGIPPSKAHELAGWQWEYYMVLAKDAGFAHELRPVVRKIYEMAGERRKCHPVDFKNDTVHIIDDQSFDYQPFVRQ